MEPIDAACEKFKEFIAGDFNAKIGTLHTESDVRLKIINPIFVDILGWPVSSISTEEQAGEKFIDYKFTIDGLARLVVEAKRDRRGLGLAADKCGKYYKLKGPVFNTEAIREGVNQAINYCGHKSAELACVSNGHEWVIFRGNRLADGHETLDGYGCAFNSLACISQNFKQFYELLSYDAVHSFMYRGTFRAAEKQPIRTSSFKEQIRKPNSQRLLPTDRIYADIDRVMVSFFRQITAEEDAEMLRDCFVTSPESDAAEVQLARISEDLIGSLGSINTSTNEELTAVIQKVKDSQRRAFALIIGTKGAGKSTFIDRFFEEKLPAELAEQCTVIRIDLADCGCGDDEIVAWLNKAVLKEAARVVW